MSMTPHQFMLGVNELHKRNMKLTDSEQRKCFAYMKEYVTGDEWLFLCESFDVLLFKDKHYWFDDLRKRVHKLVASKKAQKT